MPKKTKPKKSSYVRMYLQLEVTPQIHSRLRQQALNQKCAISTVVKKTLEKEFVEDSITRNRYNRLQWPDDNGHL